MKLKHSKIKNTGILFELLVRQIASDALENIDSKALDIIKKYFNHTELAKEYRIYEAISTSKGLNENKANMLINTIVETHKKLNQSKLNKEKYSLISAIRENYDIDNFFKAKIDNYKVFASVYLLFESSVNKEIISPKSVNGFKSIIMEHITTSNVSKESNQIMEEFSNTDKETRLLIHKILINKFNDKYKDDLNDKQKDLLREYVNNVTTTNKLKDYINEEFISVKKDLSALIEGISDPVRKIKVKQVSEIIKEIPKNKNASDDDVINLFNYYQLIDEITVIKK